MNFTRRVVLETDEFRRVLALPRRTPQDLELLADRMTAILRRAESPCGDVAIVKGLCSSCGAPVRLRTIQAQALYEISKFGGLFGPIRVGGGKTLLSLLVAFVLDARRPVLLLPAALRERTEKERLRLARHWRILQNLRILSYEELGRDTNANWFDFYRPDVVIADEAHWLKNRKAGRTRRWWRYVKHDPRTKQAWTPETRPKFVNISGTMLSRRTMKSFAYLLISSHHELAPVPLEEGELTEWAEALDETANFTRPHPGPLMKLATEPEDRVPGDDIATARRGFQRRLKDTPGVISTAGEQVANCSIYIRGKRFTPNAITHENVRLLRNTWSRPDGWPLSMAAEVWAVVRQLALGFHSEWRERPPGFFSREEPGPWMLARKNWASFVRRTISGSRSGKYDTEKQVATACSRGELPDLEYRAWLEIEPEFTPRPKDVWHDTTALEFCEAWMKEGPGIVWISHGFFGEELSRRTGAPYFRDKGLDAQGRNLETVANEVRAGRAKPMPILASRFACSTGFNLQPWNRNLITSCPSGADVLEQLIGRTHRDGQEADQVEVDIMLGCVENLESWDKALAEARMAVDTLGDSQKILIGDPFGFPSELEVERLAAKGSTTEPLWSKTPERENVDDGP